MQPQKSDSNDNNQPPSNQQAQMPHHVPISQLKELLESQKNGTLQSGSQISMPASNTNQSPTTSVMPTQNNTQQSANSLNKQPIDGTLQQITDKDSSIKNDNRDETENQNTEPKTKPTVNQNANSQNIPEESLIPALIWLQMISLVVIAIAFIPPILWRNTFLMVFGMLMVGAAIMLGVWAVTSFKQTIKINPKPNPNGFLVTGGPYKYLRHPMYLALIMAGLGLTLAYPTLPRLFALIVLITVLNAKVNIEEKLLTERYHHYDRYQRVTGKIIPKFKKPDIDIDIPKFQ